jgi:hypothetical protein
VLPAESFRSALERLVAVLDRLQIRYHLTGGITSVVYGEPRMTQDLDLVLDPERVAANPDGFLTALSATGLHYDVQVARRAIRTGGMFQLLDNGSRGTCISRRSSTPSWRRATTSTCRPPR